MRHTSHIPHHTSPITHPPSHVTHPPSHVTHPPSHVTHPPSHIPHHTSPITRHTSPITRHTSQVGSHRHGSRPHVGRCQARLRYPPPFVYKGFSVALYYYTRTWTSLPQNLECSRHVCYCRCRRQQHVAVGAGAAAAGAAPHRTAFLHRVVTCDQLSHTTQPHTVVTRNPQRAALALFGQFVETGDDGVSLVNYDAMRASEQFAA